MPAVRESLNGQNQSGNAATYGTLVDDIASQLNARVVVYQLLTPGRPRFVVADSNVSLAGRWRETRWRCGAFEEGQASGGRGRDGERDVGRGGVADQSDTRSSAVSASLGDVLSNVGLVRRSLLSGGGRARHSRGGPSSGTSQPGVLPAGSAASSRPRSASPTATSSRPVVDTGADEVCTAGRRTRFPCASTRPRLDHARREFITERVARAEDAAVRSGRVPGASRRRGPRRRKRAREFVTETRAQVERLTKLATDLLDLTRLDAGQLECRGSGKTFPRGARNGVR